MHQLDRLDLYDDLPVDDEVETLAFYRLAFIDDIDLFLALKRDTLNCELMAKGFFINGFEKSGAKNTMHFNGAGDDESR